MIDWNIFIPDNMAFSYILLPNGKHANIFKYTNMNIDYAERVFVVNGRSITNKYPAINYEIIMLDRDKEILYELFADKSIYALGYRHEYAKIVLEAGSNRKEIKCRVDAYAPIFTARTDGGPVSDDMKKIKIEILLDDSDEKLNFTREELTERMKKKLEDAHRRKEEYTRFDIMDLEEDE